MNTISKVHSVVLSAILLAAFSPAGRPVFSTSGNSSNEQTPKDGSTTAKEGKGVHIVVDVPKESYAGNAITITMKLQNDSDIDFIYTIERGYEYKFFSIEVNDSTGAIVPKTRFAQQIWPDNPMHQPPSSDIFCSLAPGDSYNRSLNIARIFDLTIVGKYTVSVSKYFNGTTYSTKAILVVQDQPY